jgi:hypothetical protein
MTADKRDRRCSGSRAWSQCLIVVFLIAGCIGDRALPIISSTPIPGTKLSIRLCGPDNDGTFSYDVLGGGIWSWRALGRLRSDQTRPPVLKDLGAGVFRIQWGDGSAYATIDTRKTFSSKIPIQKIQKTSHLPRVAWGHERRTEETVVETDHMGT